MYHKAFNVATKGFYKFKKTTVLTQTWQHYYVSSFVSLVYVFFYYPGTKSLDFLCLPGEIYNLLNVRSWFWENWLLSLSASGPVFILREAYCLNPYQGFYVWSFKSMLLIISREPCPPALQIFHTKGTIHFSSMPLSALYIGIYLFFGKKKKTLYYLRWRGENRRLILHRWGELMVFI